MVIARPVTPPTAAPAPPPSARPIQPNEISHSVDSGIPDGAKKLLGKNNDNPFLPVRVEKDAIDDMRWVYVSGLFCQVRWVLAPGRSRWRYVLRAIRSDLLTLAPQRFNND